MYLRMLVRSVARYSHPSQVLAAQRAAAETKAHTHERSGGAHDICWAISRSVQHARKTDFFGATSRQAVFPLSGNGR